MKVEDPGRPSKPGLVSNVLKSELRYMMERFLLRAGVKKLHDALPEHWNIPDSQFAKEATIYAQTLCPDYLVNHCFRSYCFGAIIAARNGLRLDRELFFVAAMLHDLGLTNQHQNDPGSFEWVGAELAYKFSLKHCQTEQVATAIHNSIALHTSVGIVESKQPEIALLHYGTGTDLFGSRLREIPRGELKEILSAYPREDFPKAFGTCLHHQADTKPETHISTAVEAGIADRILANLSA